MDGADEVAFIQSARLLRDVACGIMQPLERADAGLARFGHHFAMTVWRELVDHHAVIAEQGPHLPCAFAVERVHVGLTIEPRHHPAHCPRSVAGALNGGLYLQYDL